MAVIIVECSDVCNVEPYHKSWAQTYVSLHTSKGLRTTRQTTPQILSCCRLTSSISKCCKEYKRLGLHLGFNISNKTFPPLWLFCNKHENACFISNLSLPVYYFYKPWTLKECILWLNLFFLYIWLLITFNICTCSGQYMGEIIDFQYCFWMYWLMRLLTLFEHIY